MIHLTVHFPALVPKVKGGRTVRRGHASLQMQELPWPELPRVKETVVMIGSHEWILHDIRFSFHRSSLFGDKPASWTGDVFLTLSLEFDHPLVQLDLDDLEFEGFRVHVGEVDVHRLRLLRDQQPEILAR